MMVRVQLDAARERRLRELAESRGQDVSAFARAVLEDCVDLESLPPDTEEDWAEASAKLAGEVLGEDDWNGGRDNGSR
jgi:predicted transcriptional regulator